VSQLRLNSLPEIEAAVWRELGQACNDKSHPWRTPVLATVSAEGLPNARTVILRECDAATRTLMAFTDARSAKVAELQAQPHAMLVIWSNAQVPWQLRLQARAQVQTTGLAVSSRWAQLKLSPAAQDYVSPLAPGTALNDEPAGSLADREGRGHFAVLTFAVNSMDWLELHRDGHRRARFDAQGARWLVP
jgi:pyridoxamine 5'-phosphate oxidase